MIVMTVTIGADTWSLTDTGRILDSNGTDIGHAVTDVNGGYNIYDPSGGYFCNISPQGTITHNDGNVWGETASFDVSGQTDQPGADNIMSEVTITNPDGTASVYRLTNNGQVLNDTGKVVLTYRTSPDGRTYEIYELDGSLNSTLDVATGTLTDSSGGTVTARFNPLQHDIPMHGESSQSTTGTTTQSSSTTGSSTEQMQRGIDWNSPVAAALRAGVIDTAQNLPELARRAGEEAQDKYKNLMYNIGLQQYQGTLNSLAGKNMLSSSVAGSAMANTQQQMNQAVANKAFEASLAGTQLQMGVPGQLSNIIAALGGQVGTTTGTQDSSTTGTGSQTGTTTGRDPLDPYRLMRDLSI